MPNGVFVPFDASPVDDVVTRWRDDRVMPPRFALCDIGDMDFNSGYTGGQDGVVQSVGRVGVGAGIEDDACRGVSRLMDTVDDGAFMVRLERLERVSMRSRPGHTQLIELIQVNAAVDFGLSSAK